MTKHTKAFAYLRVSTLAQGEDGAGLDLQLSSIEAYADAAGFRIVEVFQDIHTGVGTDSMKNRPGVMAAARKSRETSSPIIVDGLDRFSRDTATLEKYVASGRLNVISARGESGSHAALMSIFRRAQEEAELISVTTKQGLERARENGVQLGNPNIADVQKLAAKAVAHKAKAQATELAAVVAALQSAGTLSKQSIANALNRRGLRTDRGLRWNATNIRRLLTRVHEINHPVERENPYLKNPNYGAFS